MYNRELITFITVADRGSFLQAANALYITPASVMNQINKLEDTVGAKLFIRTNQGAVLTAAGRSVYEDGKKLIALSEAAVKKARHLAAAEQNTIRVGTSIMRPCKRLMELWSGLDNEDLPFQIRIVPFDDDPAGLDAVLNALGDQIDCFVAPCDSAAWQKQHSILLLDRLPCRIAVPRKHPLAKKKSLSWSDLDGETLMLVRQGESAVLDGLRREISQNHPKVSVIDAPNFYDTAIFNTAEQMDCLMETLDVWTDIHPAFVTLPMAWDYAIPYGIIYAKEPSGAVKAFIQALQPSMPSLAGTP